MIRRSQSFVLADGLDLYDPHALLCADVTVISNLHGGEDTKTGFQQALTR